MGFIKLGMIMHLKAHSEMLTSYHQSYQNGSYANS
jgi:hypothetical protein